MNLTRENICKILLAFIILNFPCLSNSVNASHSLINEGAVSFKVDASNVDKDFKSLGGGKYSLSFVVPQDLEVGTEDAFFNVQGLTNWSGYNVLAVHVQNSGNSNLGIGLQVKLSPLVILAPKDGARCFFQPDQDSFLTVITSRDGMVDLSPNESGTLFIPFSSLSYKERSFPITYFTSWNFRIRAEKGSPVKLSIGDFTLYQPGELNLPDGDETEIQGESSMQIPIEGAESIGLYHIAGRQTTLRLAEEYPGVSISQEGRLTILSNAKPGIIKILADDKIRRERVIKKIIISPSVRANVKDQAGDTPLLPPVDELNPIFDPNNFWNRDEIYHYLRWCFTGVFTLGVIFFFYGNYLYQKSQKRGTQ